MILTHDLGPFGGEFLYANHMAGGCFNTQTGTVCDSTTIGGFCATMDGGGSGACGQGTIIGSIGDCSLSPANMVINSGTAVAIGVVASTSTGAWSIKVGDPVQALGGQHAGAFGGRGPQITATAVDLGNHGDASYTVGGDALVLIDANTSGICFGVANAIERPGADHGFVTSCGIFAGEANFVGTFGAGPSQTVINSVVVGARNAHIETNIPGTTIDACGIFSSRNGLIAPDVAGGFV